MFATDHLPVLIKNAVDKSIADFEQALESASLREPFNNLNPRIQGELVSVFVASDYVASLVQRKPQLILDLAASGDLWRSYDEGTWWQKLQQKTQALEDEQALSPALRLFRQREMTRVIWRDANGLAQFQETTLDLSLMADVCIDHSLSKLYQWHKPQWGTPFYPGTDREMPMVVLGMGKLGAKELNLSSDIDLIFAYAQEGETRGGRRQLDHRDYFTRLGQKLIKLLDETTVEGFVFRVDMRLRPYGNSGALALNFNALESYYEDHGREWERYAMIKARAIGTDNGDGDQLLDLLKPFVYRRYVDFGVIEALRDMKSRINQEVLRRGNQDNVKLGAGGIREIEFIAQVFQLIRGGQDIELQQSNLMQVMAVIGELQLLPETVVDGLCADYVFLRNLEHRIQALQDRQTQQLPGDELSQWRIAYGLGFQDWNQFTSFFHQLRQRVRAHFDDLIALPQFQEDSTSQNKAVAIWQADTVQEEIEQNLIELGYEDPSQAWRVIHELKVSRGVELLQAMARDRLDRLMPLLIYACAQQQQPGVTLQRVIGLVEAILRRSAYMALLVENLHCLNRLALLFSASPWVAEVITQHPMLLDELLNEAALLAPPDKEELQNQLRQVLLRIPEDDLEAQMYALRQFKLSHVLRVAASELAETMPLMKVSDYLTWLAEVVLEAVLDLAWGQMVAKYGNPTAADGSPCPREFVMVGYGKLGGIELSYRSDLDLVFIHDLPTNFSTDGDKAVDNGVFFARLGQRIIHILTSRMASGVLYVTDMRLRPSGNSGLLVSSLSSFREYQMEKAWSWEHQALVRARVVAGNPVLARKFEQIRQLILSQCRDESRLTQDVLAMRAKMLGHLASSKGEQVFDLKQDLGGIVDIEFLAQYLVLRYGHHNPAITRWTDNMRILDSAADLGMLEAEQVKVLQAAYLQYRSQIHRLALQNRPSQLEASLFAKERRQVREIWSQTLG